MIQSLVWRITRMASQWNSLVGEWRVGTTVQDWRYLRPVCILRLGALQSLFSSISSTIRSIGISHIRKAPYIWFFFILTSISRSQNCVFAPASLSRGSRSETRSCPLQDRIKHHFGIVNQWHAFDFDAIANLEGILCCVDKLHHYADFSFFWHRSIGSFCLRASTCTARNELFRTQMQSTWEKQRRFDDKTWHEVESQVLG